MFVASLRRLVHWATAAIILLGAPIASAQTIQLPSVVYRDTPARPIAQQPRWVNHSDCIAKDVFHFNLFLTGYSGFTLQVWAGNQGTNCTDTNQRQPGGNATCWLVYSSPAVQAQTQVDISAVNLVARILPDQANSSTTASVVPQGPYPDACNSSIAPTGQQLVLFFMLIAGGTEVKTSAPWPDIGYDVTAPGPPTGVTGNPGETRIHLNWTQNTDSDVIGYQFYCDPGSGDVLPDGGLKKPTFDAGLTTQGPPLGLFALSDGGAAGTAGGDTGAGGLTGAGGTAGTIDTGGAGGTVGVTGGTAGAGGTAGTGTSQAGGAGGTAGAAGAAGAAVGTSCNTASILQPGLDPTYPHVLPEKYVCGAVGKTTNQGAADHLFNNVQYVVAISTVDKVGNVGTLSSTVCVTPVAITDFFELYREAGGKAGGGICSLSRRANPVAFRFCSAAGALAALGLALRLRRRRK